MFVGWPSNCLMNSQINFKQTDNMQELLTKVVNCNKLIYKCSNKTDVFGGKNDERKNNVIVQADWGQSK